MRTFEISVLKIAMALASVAIFLSAPSVVAEPKTQLPSYVRVLSYDEVMRLPKVKRTKYLRGLRAMMREIDHLPKKMRASGEDAARYSQIASLLSLFAGEEAWAAPRDPSLPFDEGKGAGLKCGAGYGTLMVMRAVAGTQIVPQAVCTVGERASSRCDKSKTIGVKANADGTWACATLSSFGRLPDNLKSQLRGVPQGGDFLMGSLIPGNSSKAKFINGQPEAKVFSDRWAATHRPQLKIQLVDPHAPAATAAAPQVGAASSAEERARRARETVLARRGGVPPGVIPGAAPRVAAAPGGTAGARTASSAGNAESRQTSGASESTGTPVDSRQRTDYQAVDNDGSSAIVVTPVTTRASTQPEVSSESERLAGGPEVSDEEEGTSTQASAEFGSCQPQESQTCDASSIEEARRKYASDPNPDCIYAGSVSQYQDGRKRAYKCEAPTEFCFGSKTCLNSTGERLRADFSCESGQVICNPLIFGLQGDGKTPFCIEKSSNATASCDDLSREDENAVSPLDQPHVGMKEAWNDFADSLFKLCQQNKVSAALHCAECDIISTRLFALNIAARGTQNCGAALKFEESQCDAEGKCQGLPGRGESRRARAVSANAEGDFADEEPVGTKHFGVRGERGISSVNTEAPESKIKSMSDVRAREFESVFNTPRSRPK